MNTIATRGYGSSHKIPTWGYGGSKDGYGPSRKRVKDTLEFKFLVPIILKRTWDMNVLCPVEVNKGFDIHVYIPLSVKKQETYNFQTGVNITNLKDILNLV